MNQRKLDPRLPFYDWQSFCEICKRHRAHGNHQRCSKLKQQGWLRKQQAQERHHA